MSCLCTIRKIDALTISKSAISWSRLRICQNSLASRFKSKTCITTKRSPFWPRIQSKEEPASPNCFSSSTSTTSFCMITKNIIYRHHMVAANSNCWVRLTPPSSIMATSMVLLKKLHFIITKHFLKAISHVSCLLILSRIPTPLVE